MVLSWGTMIQAAQAWDASYIAKVTMIEPTYIPGRIVFKVDRGAGACAAGAALTWNAQGANSDERIANVQAVYSALQTAKATNGNVDVFVNTGNCTVEFIHLL